MLLSVSILRTLVLRGPAQPSGWLQRQQLAELRHGYCHLAHASCLASGVAFALIETITVVERSLRYIWLFGCCLRNKDCCWFTKWDRCYLQSTGGALLTWGCAEQARKSSPSPSPKPSLGCTTGCLGLHLKTALAACCVAGVPFSPQPFCCLRVLYCLAGRHAEFSIRFWHGHAAIPKDLLNGLSCSCCISHQLNWQLPTVWSC